MVVELIQAGVVGTLITAVIVPLVRFLYKKREKSKTEGNLERRLDVHVVLNKIREETNAVRSFVMVAKNNGGIPTPDVAVYTSILYESTAPKTFPVADTWQNVRADEIVAKLISNILKTGYVIFKTEDLPNSIMKDTAETLGTLGFAWHIIGTDSKKLIFLLLTWDETGEIPEDPVIRTSLRISANELKTLLK